MEFETIRYKVEDRIATITLHRPERLNAFTVQMCDDILEALDKADEDDDVRAVIFTGEGKAFCAGSDLTGEPLSFGIDRDKVSIEEHRDQGGLVSLRLFSMRKPIIAAINGAAVGVGITMTLPMDIRILSRKAKVGFVFASRGIVNEACSGWFLPRIVGMAKAMEWVSCGRLVEAEEALSAGLVTYVEEPENVYSKALEIAGQIRDNTAPVSVALARYLMTTMQTEPHPLASHKLESKMIYWCGTTKDAKEGVASFLEKREAVYTMRPSRDMPPFYPETSKREEK